MECYSEQTCALAVDGELAPAEARRLRDHLAHLPALPGSSGRIAR